MARLRLDELGDTLQFVVSALLDTGEVASAGKLFRLVSHELNREIAATYRSLPAMIEARRLVWVTDSDLQQNVELRGSVFQAVKSPACAVGPMITVGVHTYRLRVAHNGNRSGCSMNLGVIDATGESTDSKLKQPAWGFNPLDGVVRHFTDGTGFNPRSLPHRFYDDGKWVTEGATMDVTIDMRSRRLSLVLNHREAQAVDVALPAAVRVWARFSSSESVTLELARADELQPGNSQPSDSQVGDSQSGEDRQQPPGDEDDGDQDMPALPQSWTTQVEHSSVCRVRERESDATPARAGRCGL